MLLGSRKVGRPSLLRPAAEGEYVSEALLVPDRCRFLHKEQMDACKSYVYWHNIAKEVRTESGLGGVKGQRGVGVLPLGFREPTSGLQLQLQLQRP